MVEADLDAPTRRLAPRARCGRRRPPRSRPASRRGRAPTPRARAGVLGEPVVRHRDDRRRRARARAARRATDAPRRRSRRRATRRRVASTSKQATSSSRPSAAARLWPTSPQPTMPTRSGRSDPARSRVLDAEQPWNSKSNRSSGASAAAIAWPRVVGSTRVDEQEATATGADDLPADHAAPARERVEVVDPLRRHPGRAAAACSPSARASARRTARRRRARGAPRTRSRSPSSGRGWRASPRLRSPFASTWSARIADAERASPV